MRHAVGHIAVILILSLLAAAQDDAPKPIVSNNPLTAEQIAVYRAVLEDYTNGSGGALNVADRTELLDRSGFGVDEDCFKSIQAQPTKDSVLIIHKLDRSLALDKRFSLVGPGHQQDKIKENDPQKLIKSAIDNHQKVADKQVNESVKRAFETGLFTLSEILFDKQQRHALVAYSFVCGGLCGNGNLLALTRFGKKWKVTKKCGGWVS
jgi:hypothetical protein